jgi:uncharacterized Rmd1/YagE family protein
METLNISNLISDKSSEIEKIEEEIDVLLDEAEKYLNNLNIGKFSNIKDTIYLNARILRINYKCINSLGVSTAPRVIRKDNKLMDKYKETYKDFEIEERMSVIQSKLGKLKEISDDYTEFTFSRNNARRDILEIVLLTTFPLYEIIHSIIIWLS